MSAATAAGRSRVRRGAGLGGRRKPGGGGRGQPNSASRAAGTVVWRRGGHVKPVGL
jgi:hypothetical protein